jgi:hypothetical protein
MLNVVKRLPHPVTQSINMAQTYLLKKILIPPLAY